MQQEQQVEKGNLKKNEEVKAYNPQVPFPQRLQKAKLEEQFSRFLNIFKKIEINIPFFLSIDSNASLRKIHEGYIEQKE